MRDLYSYNISTCLEFSCKDWLDLGVGYQYEKEDDGAGNWEYESKPEVRAIFGWAAGKIKFKDRNRLEYKISEGSSKYRYRNRLKASFPLISENTGITCSLYNEFFYDFSANDYNQNRAGFNFSREFSKHLELVLGYMSISEKSGGNWSSINVLTTEIAVPF